MEIERKFLVKEVPDLTNSAYKEIKQLYLSYDPEVRIRKRDNKYFITRKNNGTLIREEVEDEISETAFEVLSGLAQGRTIDKTRYLYPCNGAILELDVYRDELEGLITVEVEFDDIEDVTDFSIPSWFGEEVTSDSRYKNQNLSRLNLSELTELIKGASLSKKKK